MEFDPQLMKDSMYNNFYKSAQFTLKWEVGGAPNGGYTNDSDDPGGETKYGIAKRYHPEEDIKNLTEERAAYLYWYDYWLPSHAGNLDYPLCTVVFDTAINCGVARAQQWMAEPFDYKAFLDQRTMFYAQKIKENPRKQKFLGGWTARVNDLKKLVELSLLQ